MTYKPFNIHGPNTYGVGVFLTVLPEAKEEGTEFQILIDGESLSTLFRRESGEWEWTGGEYHDEIDFGFLTSQIESNL